MNRNLPVPVKDEAVPYLQKRKHKENKTTLSKFFLILLAVVLLAGIVLCAGKFGLFSFLAGGDAEQTTTGDSTETTTGETTTNLYAFDYEKLSEDALAILPCDLSAWASGNRYHNQTSYDVESLSPQALEVLEQDTVTVLVVNTHPYEAYSEDGAFEYKDGSYVNAGSEENSVAAVAKAFIEALAKRGIQAEYVALSTTSSLHSYEAAYEALTAALAEYPDVRYIVDIHRDILLDDDGNMLRPVTAGEAGTMAQMRLVIGTDADGAPYENWEEGASAALALAEKLTASYPSLLMPTEISRSRLNQHLPVTVFTAEIGTCGNSVEESVRTAQAFGEVFAAAVTQTDTQ